MILTEDLTYVSSQLEHYEEGKLRCGVIEQKLKNLKRKNDLQSQPKANMVLFSSVLLNESIKKNPTGVEGISLITCYALLVWTYSLSNLVKE